MTKKCIYCGSLDNLSESDIIPDALTNARILNKNVCKIEHNNKFSDLFESEVINKLAFITNSLDIKSSKGNHYPRYSAVIIIDGIEYKVKYTTETELFKGKKIRSVDGKKILGPIEDIKRIAHNDDSKVTTVDPNSLEIEKVVNINMEVFVSNSMFRLVAKIAYEWYCLLNDIKDKYSDFDEIIEFITVGNQSEIVSIIDEEAFYNLLKIQSSHGSHNLILYIGKDNAVYAAVSLFGIAVYKVKICDHIPSGCLINCAYYELCTDGSCKKQSFESLEQLCIDLQNSFQPIKCGCLTALIPVDMGDTMIITKLLLIEAANILSRIESVTSENDHIVKLIKKNMESILQASLLHKKSLKRFVKEHFKTFSDEIILNPNGSNKKDLFLFYIIYLVGNSSYEEIDMEKLYSLVKEKLGIQQGNEYVINEELCEKIKSLLLNDKNYSEVLHKGAKMINDWN
ncbi:MAG: hypothetical protein ABRQ25_08400 [Clostridiaceae bacterium]